MLAVACCREYLAAVGVGRPSLLFHGIDGLVLDVLISDAAIVSFSGWCDWLS